MAGPINTAQPGGIQAPRPPLFQPPQPATPQGQGATLAPGLGRDERQLSGSAPTPQALPDLRGESGSVSLDDFLAQDLSPRGAADARRDAEALWHEAEPQSVYRFHDIQRDAFPVNEALGPEFDQEALGQVKANQGLEEAALGKLSAEQKAQYQELVKTTGPDPMARLALQVLLVEGKLTDGPKATGGGDLLRSLHDVATRPVFEGLDRARLVNDLMQEVALPTAIAQGNNGTCTVASVQIKLARQNPAEYARLVGGLASPQGEVTLANGDVTQRDPGSETPSARSQKFRMPSGEIVSRPSVDSRSDASRLFQSAFMQYGVDPGNDYNPVTDTMQDARYMGPTLTGKALAGLSGKPVETLLSPDARVMRQDDFQRADSHEALFKRIAEVTDKGQSVTVGLAWGEADADGKIHGFHAIDVTRVEDGRAYYANPWGKEESMAVEELTKRARYAQYTP